MKHPSPVIFDVDGVLADFCAGFTALASGMFGVPVVRAMNQPTYHWQGLTKDQVNQVWRSIDSAPGFWETLPCLIGGQELAKIHCMTAERPVYFVTARPDYAKHETEYWLKKHGIYFPTVITTKRKGEFAKAVEAGFCIEDKPSNASMVAWLTDGKTESFLLDRPYNQAPQDFVASGVERIYTVAEYLEAIQE